jgi:DNA-binding CsgD family transcriptional regulator
MAGARSDIVARCIDGLRAGRCVAIEGPAGMGKTTTVTQVEDEWTRLGKPVHRATVSLSARRISLAALGGLIRRTTTTVAEAVDDLRGLDGLLVVDDADLLDDDSAVVIHTVARTRPTLITLRTERSEAADASVRLAREHTTDLICLDPLGLTDAMQLVESLIGGTIDRASINTLVSASEGNPLLLRELTASSAHGGSLVLAHGVWGLRELIAPGTVRELFRERLRLWSPVVRRVVTAVAVAESVPLALLTTCFGQPAVAQARSADAFRSVGRTNDVELRHALLRETVLANVELAERNELLRLLLTESENNPAVTPLRRGLWVLTLGDHERLDVAFVVRAADYALDSLQLSVAASLARLAFRHDPGKRSLEMLARLGLHQADVSVGNDARENTNESNKSNESDEIHDGVTDPQVRIQSLTGRFEAFLVGLGPSEDLLEQVQMMQASDAGSEHRRLCETYSRSIEWVSGQHVDLSVEALAHLAEGDTSVGSTVVASLFASTACLFSGQLVRATEIATRIAVTDNPFHVAQVAFTNAQGLLHLGKHSEAIAMAERLETLSVGGNLAARLYRLTFDAMLQLQSGNPHDAVRTLGAILSQLHGLDAVGIGTWAQRWLGAAMAWTGAGVGKDQRQIDVPVSPHCRYLAAEFGLAEAIRLAESGRLHEARAEALGLADRASGSGQHRIAMWAAHLAVRVQPSRSVAEIVGAEARFVDGDVADVIAEHADALVDDHGPSMEKLALRLVELEHLSLAQETLVRASRSYRAGGLRGAATRCASAAQSLVAAGCVPTFASKAAPASVDALTLREREVVLATAQGQSHRAVAAALGMSIRTVETHLHRAYRKLGISSAAELGATLEV